jgi:hypothetical protein
MLWDRYYDAITLGFEEAYVYRQTEVTIEEKDKQYYKKLKRAISNNKLKDKKSFKGILKMLDQKRRQVRAKANALANFIQMKKEKFRVEYRKYRKKYDSFTLNERLAQKMWNCKRVKPNLFEMMLSKKYEVKKGSNVNFVKLIKKEEKEIKMKEYEKKLRKGKKAKIPHYKRKAGDVASYDLLDFPVYF